MGVQPSMRMWAGEMVGKECCEVQLQETWSPVPGVGQGGE